MMNTIGVGTQAESALLSKLNITSSVATPTTGQTVVMTANENNQLLWLNPAGTLAALTVTLPANATSRTTQIVYIGSSQTITTLTINGAGTIYNAAAATLAPGDIVSLIKVANDAWAALV